MNSLRYIARSMAQKGVRYMYGIPGGPSIAFIDALKEEGVEFILTSDEASAGVMAAVTGRVTGVPGVCHATFGPGATNLATGVGTALLDRNPLIAFTTEMNDYYKERTAQMNVDHQALFAPLTKATFRLNKENCPALIDQAFNIATSEYPGPVHLGMPSDFSKTEVGEAGKEGKEFNPIQFKNPDNDIISLLQSVKKPLLVVGLTAARHNLQSEILKIVTGNNIPIVITPMAKGVIDESNPLFGGVLFHALSHHLKPLIDSCDAIIGVGYDPVEYNYESWCGDKPIIHFNTLLTDLPPASKTLQFISAPKEWFSFMGRHLKVYDYTPKDVSMSKANNPKRSKQNAVEGNKLSPVHLLERLRELIPEEMPVAFDVGSHLHVAGKYWRTPSPEKMIITNGWSSMGFAVPAANALALNDPGGRAVAILGDGCFLMRAGEVMTARRYNLNVLYIILNDNELNLIKVKQGWQKSTSKGTTIVEGDFFNANHFLGIPLSEVNTLEDLATNVGEALKRQGPSIINVSIDPADYHNLISRQ